VNFLTRDEQRAAVEDRVAGHLPDISNGAVGEAPLIARNASP
jgi:hypothetical protein